jgi:hypothetical protein
VPCRINVKLIVNSPFKSSHVSVPKDAIIDIEPSLKVPKDLLLYLLYLLELKAMKLFELLIPLIFLDNYMNLFYEKSHQPHRYLLPANYSSSHRSLLITFT